MIGGSALNANTNPTLPSTFARSPNTNSAPLSEQSTSTLMPAPTLSNVHGTQPGNTMPNTSHAAASTPQMAGRFGGSSVRFRANRRTLLTTASATKNRAWTTTDPQYHHT